MLLLGGERRECFFFFSSSSSSPAMHDLFLQYVLLLSERYWLAGFADSSSLLLLSLVALWEVEGWRVEWRGPFASEPRRKGERKIKTTTDRACPKKDNETSFSIHA